MPPRTLAPVPGFHFAGIAGGIKQPDSNGKAPLDLGAIVSLTPCPVAAVVTKNRVRAAPARLCATRAKNGIGQAVLVNSGNANAATGTQGMQDTKRTTAAFARRLDIDETLIFPCSTGVIGVPLPADKITSAMPRLMQRLSARRAGEFSRAILTTDKGPKVARRTFVRGNTEYQVLAIAKGAGMIHPNMATTLAFVITDFPVGQDTLSSVLRESTDRTFNRITVDGDTSTNDTIIAMSASGRQPGKRALDHFSAAVRGALGAVAEKIVADGEGAEHVAVIHVEGARSEKAALQIARTIATSNLVKTAMYGKDPNWGRIAGAAGRAGVVFDEQKLTIEIGGVVVFDRGSNVMDAAREKAAGKVMKKKRYVINVGVGDGPGSAHYLTCDLGHGYVSVNADYRS